MSSIDEDEVGRRLRSLRRRLRAAALDGAVLTSPASVHYFGGAQIHTQRLMPRRQAAVVVPLKHEPTLVVARAEGALAARQSPLRQLTYDDSTEPIDRPVLAALRFKRDSVHRLGIEAEHLPFADARRLQRASRSRLVSCDAITSEARVVKTEAELERIRRASEIALGAIRRAVGSTSHGDSEHQLAARIVASAVEAGGGRIALARGLVASGDNLFVTHHVAGSRLLRSGDVLRVGCHLTYDGYHCLVARTAVAGRAPRGLTANYRALAECHEALVATINVGLTCSDVFYAAQERQALFGVPVITNHVGHGIGLDFSEHPHLAADSMTEIRSGMALLAVSVTRDATYGNLYLEDVCEVGTSSAKVLPDSAVSPELLVVTKRRRNRSGRS